MKSKGMVYLVGAGPGDPGLLTLRGAEVLRRAQVVVADSLVSPAVVRLAPAEATIVQRAKDHPLRQKELNARLVAWAAEGKTVVRLKGGDPYVFGRGGEEAASLAAAGVPFEVVPGVSLISAVPNCAGIPLTHRDHCSSFTVFTGHDEPGQAGSRMDWAHLAQEPGTKVVLMGAERLPQLASALVAQGLPATTPAAVVHWGTTARQETVVGTLADIAPRVADAGLAAPVVTIVGSVVNLRSSLNWFESRPLFGRRVVVTRSRDQAPGLTGPLRERGADVLEIPCLRTGPPANRQPVIEVLAGLGEYDWLVFTSANGVTAFFDLFFKGFEDIRALGNLRLAAVGPATAAKLTELHLRVDVTPKEFTAHHVVKALAAHESLENLRVLLLRAEVANPELPKTLEDLGAIVDDVACYQTLRETEDVTGDAARLIKDGADWITFASGSAVEHFHGRFDLPALLNRFPMIRLASVGAETTKALTALGIAPTVEAKIHTMDGLVSAIERADGRRSR